MAQSSPTRRARAHSTRLGFRVDADTKKLVQRAAELEQRTMTDFCLAVLTRATQETISRHESLALSERDRAVFFDALIHPPKPNARLRRAFQLAADRATF